MKKLPGPGEKYRHLKKGMCQVITLAEHSETGKNLVVYQALQDGFSVYATELELFQAEFESENKATYQTQMQQEQTKPLKKAEPMEKMEEIPEEAPGGINPLLMEFLETDSLEKRYNILVSMRDIVDNGMIDTMAVVLDTVIPDGELMKRYDDLKHVIHTKQQYENANRLR